MSETVLIGFLAAVGGVLAAAIPAWIALRRGPSRITTDAVSLVDASGQVVSNLTDEIHRLEKRVDDAERHLEEAQERCSKAHDRVEQLERVLIAAGISIPKSAEA